MTRARAKAIALIVGVFALGAVAGAGGAHAIGKRRMAELVAEDREELREERRLRALRRSLELTDDQVERVGAALRTHRAARREAMVRMHEDCGAPIEKAQEALDADLREILRPDQLSRFDEIRARHGRGPFGRKRRGLGRGLRRGGPPGGQRPPPP